MARHIDSAMLANRPQKQFVRGLWVREVERFADKTEPEVPLYLTLSGAEGLDIEILAEKHIISLTSVHGIAAEDKGKIVAVESSPTAVLQLQQKFPGLKIIEAPIQSLVKGDNPIRWPDSKEQENLCRARVINLDINAPLTAEEKAGQAIFPLLEQVKKFALLHAVSTPIAWSLLLTIHAEAKWEPGICRGIQEFIGENCEREPLFGENLKKVLGAQLLGQIIDAKLASFAQLTIEEQQALLMTFVPKKIVSLVQNQCWSVEVRWNYCYGGRNRQAPMATWAIAFNVDKRATTKPDAVYRENLRKIFSKTGRISEDGSIEPDFVQTRRSRN